MENSRRLSQGSERLPSLLHGSCTIVLIRDLYAEFAKRSVEKLLHNKGFPCQTFSQLTFRKEGFADNGF